MTAPLSLSLSATNSAIVSLEADKLLEELLASPHVITDISVRDLKFMPDIPELHEDQPQVSVQNSWLSKLSDGAICALSSAASIVPTGLVYVDHLLDLVPFAGTASNVIDLGVKYLVVKDVDPNSSFFKSYITHIQNKDTKECVAYGLPFVGTVAKIGTTTYSFFVKPVPKEENYTLIDQTSVSDEDMMSLSTIGMRLKEQEQQQADAIVRQVRFSRTYGS